MTFSEYLNECMKQAGCNARELAAASGLSQAVISRYRSGERIPSLGSDQLNRIIQALIQLSEENGKKAFTEEELAGRLSEILHDEPGSVLLASENLNAIFESMDINIKKLSQSISYDPSYISRIKSGQRKPSNPITFAQGVIRYMLESCDPERLREVVSKQSGIPQEALQSEEALSDALSGLLIRHWGSVPVSPVLQENESASALDFVRKLSEFNLDEYIRAIHFDTLKVPVSPISLPASKAYYGIEEMKQCELDFFRMTVLSRAKDPIYMCSDMDMADMAQDIEFGRKWMFAIAMAIKKGLRLNIIHTLDRPFHEMMLGLESWIPLYMTGQVSSWYLPGTTDKVYAHLHYVSGAAALTGECIRGHHDNGRYCLTNNKKDIAFYHSYCTWLFGRAKPLMAIFTKENAQRYEGFLSSSAGIPGTRRLILSAPPLASMPESLLAQILKRCGDPKMIQQIKAGAATQRRLLSLIMSRERCEMELCSLSREEFNRRPAALSLADIFPEHNLYYTWEEYQQHIAATKEFAGEYPLSTLTVTDRPGFNNIRIHVLKGRWAMVSKNVSPAIHFVIRHPRLRSAIENMKLPIVE